jgi:hypothetical protein
MPIQPVMDMYGFLLFQGLWKIPSEDIDRAGSFASHLTRSLVLLLEVLRDVDDALSLFQIHMQLTRVPDQGKLVAFFYLIIKLS